MSDSLYDYSMMRVTGRAEKGILQFGRSTIGRDGSKFCEPHEKSNDAAEYIPPVKPKEKIVKPR